MDDAQKPTRRVSLVDVANKAFVHHSTASRALAGSPQVSEETARRVRAAAEELGYSPDPLARLLKGTTPRRPLVAVVSDEPSMTGLHENSQAFWYFLSLGIMKQFAQDEVWAVQTTANALELLVGLPIEVLVLLSIVDQPINVPEELRDVPLIVERGRPGAETATGRMGHDHTAMAIAACELLARKGSRNIAFQGLSPGDSITPRATEGYLQWCEVVGQQPILVPPALDPQTQFDTVTHALHETEFDGIYAISAEAAPLLDAIRSCGKRCPEDVQVVGIGAGLVEKFFTPPLSAAFLDGEASGRAVGNLVSAILAGKPDQLADFPWSVVERGSTRSD